MERSAEDGWGSAGPAMAAPSSNYYSNSSSSSAQQTQQQHYHQQSQQQPPHSGQFQNHQPPQQQPPLSNATPQQVLARLMNDGTFDSLRVKATNHLKNNEELKRYTQSLVEQSPTLSCPGAENRTKRDLFEALRRELEGPVLERAAKAAWDLIHSKEGLGKEIADTVDAVYHKLVGQEFNQAEMRTPSQDNLPKANGQAASYSYPSGSRSMEDRGDQVMDSAEPIRKRRGYSDS